MGVDADAGAAPDTADDAADHVAVQGPAVIGDQAAVSTDVGQVRGGPLGCELDQVGVERNVTVVAQLAKRDAQPVRLADADDGVGFEAGQLAGRMPVRASSSMTSRSRGSGQARAAAMSRAASRSSRNLGSGSGFLGMPPPRTGCAAGRRASPTR